MTRSLTLLFCIICIRTVAQPAFLANKPFAAKWHYIDSLDRSMRGQETADVQYKISVLETWADEHNDPELAGELTLLKYRKGYRQVRPELEEKKLLELVEMAHKNGMECLEADVRYTLGNFYWQSYHKEDLALENYITAYKLYSKYTAEQFPSKREYIYSLGSTYYSYGDIDNAIRYLKEASVTKADRNELYYTIYNTLGLCYRKLGRYDTSEWYFRKTYNDATTNGDTVWQGISGGNIGILYYMQKKYAEAIPLLEKDIELGLSHHVIQNAAGSMYTLAAAYFEQNQVDSCQQLLERALAICEPKPFWPNYKLAEQIFTLLYKVYAIKGDMRRAYLYADSALTAKDSVVSRSNALSLAKAQERSEFVQRKLEAEKLEVSQLALAKKRNETIFFIVGIVVMLIIIAIMIRNYRLLSAEKKKSEELLLNILPSEVADELKETGTASARHFDNVTVLFTDFVNFTQAGERMSPQELVGELHACFKAFDSILGKYNIEKIKTVGDAYLAVAGLPVSNANHAIDVVAAALEIRSFMWHRKMELGDTTFGVRIGIHSGSVVAGIVGMKKFAYDIWGDTVNTAARMEQNSEAGKINISEATYQLVKDTYKCVHRGKIEVKNKGVIDMYFVT